MEYLGTHREEFESSFDLTYFEGHFSDTDATPLGSFSPRIMPLLWALWPCWAGLLVNVPDEV